MQTLFRSLGLSDARLKINSLGDGECRPKYLESLSAHIQSLLPTLCEDCQRRAEKNPLRVLDCKIDREKLAGAPTIDQFWCVPCRTHFEKVQALLKQSGGTFELVPRLVRGLDYYSRTVFEVTSSALGAQDALAAGGRYDKLVKDLGGPDIPAIGFAMGVERAIQAMQAASKMSELLSPQSRVKIFVAALGEAAAQEAFASLQWLRQDKALAAKNMIFEGGFFDKKLTAQLTIANRINATHCLILGDEELKAKKVILKTLATGNQETLELERLIPHLLSLNA